MTYDFSNPSYIKQGKFLKSLLNADLTDSFNLSNVLKYEQVGLERKSGIYVIVNTKTGDYYVGSSIDTRKRQVSHWYSMLNDAGGGNVLLRRHAIKYGIESFKFLVIHRVNKDALEDSENFWIGALSPFYNTTKVARRPNMSDSGKASVSYRSKYIRNNNVYKVPVLQFSIDGEFIKEWNSVKEATIGVGCSGGHISSACRTGHKAFGFLWKYKNGMTKGKPRLKNKNFDL